MTRAYLLSFLAGIVSALLFATVNVNFGLAAIVAPFTPVPLYLAGLSLGLRAALLAGVTASVLVGLAPGSLHFYGSLMYAALILGPTALMVRQAVLSRERADGAREWYPAGRLLTVLVATMSGLFLLGYGLFAATGEGLLATLTEMFEATYQALGSPDAAPGEALPQDAARATAEMMVQWMPASLVLGNAISMLLAHGVLLRLNKAIRPSLDLMRLELPAALTYALAGCVLLALLAPGELGLIGRSLALALAVAFVFLGLTVVHAFARRLSGGGIIVLILVYGIMLFVIYAAAAIAALGVLERWLRLRARAAGSGAAAKGQSDGRNSA
ncbi:MAG TPA: DUF2232 domain-containing protein [Alphaproteobacteria bacterium]|nr:DUF2232 domain-containing protein [Alphaproteobacteria bacterium]